MTQNIAPLGYEIDSSQAVTAASNLDKMADASARAATGADDLAKSSDKIRVASGGITTAYKAQFSSAKQIADIQKQFNATLIASSRNTTTLGNSVRSSNHHILNMGFQFQDIGMMLASGQSPFMLAMQQGTQLSGIFNQMRMEGQKVGPSIVRGFTQLINPMSLVTIAAIAGGAALVQWGMAALGASDDAKSFEDGIGDLADAISELKSANDVFSASLDEISKKYGVVNPQIIEHLRLLREDAQMQLERSATDAVSSLIGEYDGLFSTLRSGISDIYNVNIGKANILANELEKVRSAADLSDKISAAVSYRNMLLQLKSASSDWNDEQQVGLEKANKIVDELMQAKVQADRIAATDIATSIGAGANEAARLSGNIANAVDNFNALARAKAGIVNQTGRGSGMDEWLRRRQDQMGGSGLASTDDEMNKRIDAILNPPALGEGGGGGGADRLQSLLDSLRTEREVVDAWYAESQALLNDRRALEVMSAQEHNEAKLRLEDEYQRRLAGIRGGYNGTALDQTQTFMGDMASALQGGNEKMVKIAQVFASVEALINAYRAYNQVLADPSLPWFAKIPAAVSVLAAGMKTVQAIKGLKGSAGGGSSSPSSASGVTQQQQPERIVRISFDGPDWAKDMVTNIASQLYEASEDGARVIIAR